MSDTLRVSNLAFGNVASNFNQAQLGYNYVGAGSTSNYAFHQFSGTTNTLCWTANGTVGIGITNPGATLHVMGTIWSPGGPTGSTYTVIDFRNISVYGIYATSTGITARGSTLDWYGTDWNGGTVVQRPVLTMRPEGNVGIGITNPGGILHVYGNGGSTNGFSSYLAKFQNSANSPERSLIIGADGTSAMIQSVYNGTSTAWLSLNPLGNNVGVGTTSPGATLHVNGSSKLGTSGTPFTSVVAFIATLGTGTTGVNAYTITYPTAYTNATKLVINVTLLSESGTAYGDTLTHTIRSVSTASFVLNVVRADTTAAWGQSLRANVVVYELV